VDVSMPSDKARQCQGILSCSGSHLHYMSAPPVAQRLASRHQRTHVYGYGILRSVFPPWREACVCM